MTQTSKEKAEAIMQVQATYCNSMEWSFTNLGARLTFGELSILDGEPPTHRVAVFLPWAVFDAALYGLVGTAQEVKTKMQEVQEQAEQTKPN